MADKEVVTASWMPTASSCLFRTFFSTQCYLLGPFSSIVLTVKHTSAALLVWRIRYRGHAAQNGGYIIVWDGVQSIRAVQRVWAVKDINDGVEGFETVVLRPCTVYKKEGENQKVSRTVCKVVRAEKGGRLVDASAEFGARQEPSKPDKLLPGLGNVEAECGGKEDAGWTAVDDDKVAFDNHSLAKHCKLYPSIPVGARGILDAAKVILGNRVAIDDRSSRE